MKHGFEAAAAALGASLTPDATAQLTRYATWLKDEAIAAGGLGPGEGPRVEVRHIVDSLAFDGLLSESIERVLDIGTGVGLPGIPLAVLRPGTRFVLLDRSERRCDLARRASAMLDLTNIEIRCADVAQVEESFPGVVMRAALPIDRAWRHLSRLLEPAGIAVVGWTASGPPPDERRTRELAAAARSHSLDLEVLIQNGLDSALVFLRITRT